MMSQHGKLFQLALREHRQKLLESFAIGHARHPYQRLVGQIQAIDDALKISEQADYQINGEEPDAGA